MLIPCCTPNSTTDQLFFGPKALVLITGPHLSFVPISHFKSMDRNGPISPQTRLNFAQCSHASSSIYYDLDTTNMCALPKSAGYAEENSNIDYGTSSCYYNCSIDSSMAQQCRNYANISVTSYPSTTNQSVSTPKGVNYTISDLQRCQRYTVEVTTQVGAHKYTNQTEDTVTLGRSFQ